jgi:hypothetical protein
VGDTLITIRVVAENTAVARDYEILVKQLDVSAGNALYSLEEFDYWLSTKEPNTAETAYTIRFADLNLQSLADSVDSGSRYYKDGLGQVLSLLQQYRRYVNLDLSLCTGEPGEGDTGRDNESPATTSAFRSRRSAAAGYITGITLPPHITRIPRFYFWQCRNLTSFDFTVYPNLQRIGTGAFQQTGLSGAITLPAVDLGYMDDIGSTAIAHYVFYGTSITALDMSQTRCSAVNLSVISGLPLASLKLPSACSIPGSQIMYSGALSIPSLQTIRIPAEIQASSRFSLSPAMPNLTFELEDNHPAFELENNGTALMEKLENNGKKLVFVSRSTGPFVIPEGVTVLNAGAFSNTAITSVSFPSTLIAIEAGAFKGCVNLAALGGFENVPLAAIPDSLFEGCSSLGSVTLNPATTAIGANAFKNAALAAVTLHPAITTLGSYCFSGTQISSVTLPGSIGSWGEGCFSGTPLSSVTLSEGITALGSYCFSETQLSSVTLPSTVTSVGAYAFNYCRQLTTVDMGAATGLAAGRSVFYYCTALTDVTLAAGMMLPREIFYGCSSLAGIDLSMIGGLTNNDNFTAHHFFYGTKIASLALPSAVTSLPGRAFAGCPLQWIEFQATTGIPPSEPSGYTDNLVRVFPDSLVYIFVPDSMYNQYIVSSKWPEVLRMKVRKVSERDQWLVMLEN